MNAVKLALLASALTISTAAFAQTAPAPVPARPAQTTAGAGGPLEAGANSFTEAQARERIEGAGFSAVTDLKKGDDGIWRGRATRGGQSTSVGVDFRGNVATQ